MASSSLRVGVAFVLLGALIGACAAFGPNPVITNLPGFGPTREKQYAGFLPIRPDGSEQSGLFYWLFESRSNPRTDRMCFAKFEGL